MQNWDIIYQSSEMLIGKHRWRIQVFAHPSYGACTRYQWYDNHLRFWKDEEQWPTYNHNDGCHAGIPKTLSKLYYQHEGPIHEALISGKEDWLSRHDRSKDEWGWDHVQKSLNEMRERWTRRRAELLIA